MTDFNLDEDILDTMGFVGIPTRVNLVFLEPATGFDCDDQDGCVPMSAPLKSPTDGSRACGLGGPAEQYCVPA